MVRRLTAALAAGIITAIVATSAPAGADVIKERQALLKQFGDATKPIGGMLRGSVPFDLAQVQAALDLYVTDAKVLPTLFPAGSGTGDTEALPAIWTNKADFDARFAKLGTDAAAARAAITDEARFKASFPGVVRNCGGCHDNYRQKN
ncbi:c-type cytochrome [Ancylobacter vacuolatus]|uniref:Cytochrome c556 n=1 Tax=Ancylobacter vacuolatus TaxID=223389 RepID=A0ABU0DB04_9HYPH|nr:cytochrome c [Ancylobacter vacuolatus]MDQ0345609.1 cytochrome c556 [Ancylobacter vacuolatus]